MGFGVGEGIRGPQRRGCGEPRTGGHALICLVAAYEDTLQRCHDDEKTAAAIKPQMALLCARQFNACSGRLKWQQFRYGPIDGNLWSRAGEAYLAAVRAQVADMKVSLYGSAGTTTPDEGST